MKESRGSICGFAERLESSTSCKRSFLGASPNTLGFETTLKSIGFSIKSDKSKFEQTLARKVCRSLLVL